MAQQELDNYEFDDEDELAALIAINEEGDGYSSAWRHGETLINENYWKEAAEMVDDLLPEEPIFINDPRKESA